MIARASFLLLSCFFFMIMWRINIHDLAFIHYGLWNETLLLECIVAARKIGIFWPEFFAGYFWSIPMQIFVICMCLAFNKLKERSIY